MRWRYFSNNSRYSMINTLKCRGLYFCKNYYFATYGGNIEAYVRNLERDRRKSAIYTFYPGYIFHINYEYFCTILYLEYNSYLHFIMKNIVFIMCSEIIVHFKQKLLLNHLYTLSEWFRYIISMWILDISIDFNRIKSIKNVQFSLMKKFK